MKNFNLERFIIYSVGIWLLLIPSFAAIIAKEEGTLGTNIIWIAFEKLFYILRFPLHTIIQAFGFIIDAKIYFLGVLINCLFYSLLIERLISFLKLYTKK